MPAQQQLNASDASVPTNSSVSTSSASAPSTTTSFISSMLAEGTVSASSSSSSTAAVTTSISSTSSSTAAATTSTSSSSSSSSAASTTSTALALPTASSSVSNTAPVVDSKHSEGVAGKPSHGKNATPISISRSASLTDVVSGNHASLSVSTHANNDACACCAHQVIKHTSSGMDAGELTTTIHHYRVASEKFQMTMKWFWCDSSPNGAACGFQRGLKLGNDGKLRHFELSTRCVNKGVTEGAKYALSYLCMFGLSLGNCAEDTYDYTKSAVSSCKSSQSDMKR